MCEPVQSYSCYGDLHVEQKRGDSPFWAHRVEKHRAYSVMLCMTSVASVTIHSAAYGRMRPAMICSYISTHSMLLHPRAAASRTAVHRVITWLLKSTGSNSTPTFPSNIQTCNPYEYKT